MISGDYRFLFWSDIINPNDNSKELHLVSLNYGLVHHTDKTYSNRYRIGYMLRLVLYSKGWSIYIKFNLSQSILHIIYWIMSGNIAFVVHLLGYTIFQRITQYLFISILSISATEICYIYIPILNLLIDFLRCLYFVIECRQYTIQLFRRYNNQHHKIYLLLYMVVPVSTDYIKEIGCCGGTVHFSPQMVILAESEMVVQINTWK